MAGHRPQASAALNKPAHRDVGSVFLVLVGLMVAGALWRVRRFPDDPAAIPRFLPVLGVSFVFYFAALLWARRRSVRLPAVWIVAVAVLVQLAPYHGRPIFDHDAYRYHWDGLQLAHGVNPYRYPPGDHALAHLRDEFWPRVDFKQIRTIYPPVNELFLAATYFLDRTPRRVLLLAMLFNLLCLWPLLLLMRRRGVADKWLIIYAWNPLLANEFALGGHQDPISVFFLLAALCALDRERCWETGLLLGLAIMSKTQMALVAPLLVWRGGWKTGVGAAGVCAVLLAPFLAAGADMLQGSLAYLRQWENNSSIFGLLRAGLGYLLGGATARQRWLSGGAVARPLTGLMLLALTGYLTFRRGDVARHVAFVLAAALLLGPVFFPWYLSWVLPFACLFPVVSGPVASLLLLATYLYLYDKSLGFAARIPEMVLMYGVMGGEYLVKRNHRG